MFTMPSRLEAQFLYKVTNPTQDEVLFIFGTYHNIPDTIAFQIEPLIDSLIKISDVVFSEYYGNNGHPDYKGELRLLNNSFKADNLRQGINKSEYRELIKFYKSNYNIPSRTTDKFLIYNSFIFYRRMYAHSISAFNLDLELFRIAQLAEKRIIHLDDRMMIQQVVDLENKRYNKDWLMRVVRGEDEYSYMNKEVLMAYLNKDINELMTIDEELKIGEPEWLITGRNRVWMEKYSAYKENVNFLFAGISHIIRKDTGLLDLFKARGYTIEPMSINK
jgi:uncharacterized protein YbaP (TraB family)